uniref:glutaminase n=1 Tax=Sinocyclocheilus rhinocerous TaxID=307959 RepID=A0A673HN74_9TELE
MFSVLFCVLRSNKVVAGLEDLLFYTITQGEEKISVARFLAALKSTGLLTSDPRLRECMRQIHQAIQESVGTAMMDQELFRKCVGSNIVLLTQAFQRKFIIPDFESFTSLINHLYYNAQAQKGGKVANYIPQLAKFSPDLWGASLCTVDGQRHAIGDTDMPFCLQSCVKPLEYALAVHETGTELVHRYVGKEPSGLKFNKLYLDEEDKPHNPMVNAGAIVISSLLKVRIYLTIQSEKSETGDRNYAIGYYLKEKRCFPSGVDMMAALDFYFQNKSVVDLMFAAYSGDVSALRRIALSAVNMELTDYDTRTSLHVASAEGHLDAVKFLTHTCKVNPYAKDRWGNTPLDDAMQFGHSTVVKALQEYQSIYTHTLMPEELSLLLMV